MQIKDPNLPSSIADNPEGNPGTPVFVRLPRNGSRCPWTGLSRTTLNGLILQTKENDCRPPVRSICLRKKGHARGARLIVFDSLVNYLSGLGANLGEGGST
jgi:hypothetical protein